MTGSKIGRQGGRRKSFRVLSCFGYRGLSFACEFVLLRARYNRRRQTLLVDQVRVLDLTRERLWPKGGRSEKESVDVDDQQDEYPT